MTQRICDCAYQFKDHSLPGCAAFIVKPEECWNRCDAETARAREKEVRDRNPIQLNLVNTPRFSEDGCEFIIAKRNQRKRG